jgi:hypothetical protein
MPVDHSIFDHFLDRLIAFQPQLEYAIAGCNGLLL